VLTWSIILILMMLLDQHKACLLVR
jgi:hypothetical protein